MANPPLPFSWPPPHDPGLTLTFRRLIAREWSKGIAGPIPLRLKAFRKAILAERTSVRGLSTAGMHKVYSIVYKQKTKKKKEENTHKAVDTKMKAHKMLDIFA